MADENGALLKVLSFFNYVYVFRSYGITRLLRDGRTVAFFAHAPVCFERQNHRRHRVRLRRQNPLFDSARPVRLRRQRDGENFGQAFGTVRGGGQLSGAGGIFRRKILSRLPLEFQRRTQSDVRKGRLRKQRACGGGFGKRQRCRGARRGRPLRLRQSTRPTKIFCLPVSATKREWRFSTTAEAFSARRCPSAGFVPRRIWTERTEGKLLRYALIETEHDLTLCVEARRTGTHKICQRAPTGSKRCPFNVTGSVFRLSVDRGHGQNARVPSAADFQGVLIYEQ